jgi:hypothetical protein
VDEPNPNIGFLNWLNWYVGGVINDTDYKLYDDSSAMAKQTYFYKNTAGNIAYPQESKTGKLVDLLKFLPKFRSILMEKLRHPHDVYSAGNINADLCYSETLFYEIEKKVMKFVTLDSENSGGSPLTDPLGNPIPLQVSIVDQISPKMVTIQKIYIPVSQISDYIKYIDTQVKYGKKYTYTVNEVKMVFGIQYRHITTPSFF